MQLDVLVVGGGAAGSVCAAALASEGARVALIDSGRVRPQVGELLHPAARRALLLEGVAPAVLAATGSTCGGLTSAWGDARAGAPREAPADGTLCLDRGRFDGALRSFAATRGAIVHGPARIQGRPAWNGRWSFRLASGGRSWACQADFVVEATGRTRSTPFAPDRVRQSEDATIALAWRVDPTEGEVLGALVESVESGWWYSVRLPGGALALALFTDADLLPAAPDARARFARDALREARWTRHRLARGAQALTDRPPQGHDARMGVRTRALTDGWMAVGDAFASLDPLSGQGIAEAVRSGRMAAACLLGGRRASRRSRAALAIGHGRARYLRHCRRRVQTYRRETTWSEAPFWRRRMVPRKHERTYETEGVACHADRDA